MRPKLIDILKKIGPKIQLAYKKQVAILCDAHGLILEIYKIEDSQHLRLIQELERKKNIFSVFNIPSTKILDKFLDQPMAISAMSGLNLFEADNFYTALPGASLRLHKLKDDFYLGIISVTDFLPTYFPEKSMSVILIDKDDILQGFNTTFHNYFKDIYKTPAEMLGRRACDLLVPSPLQTQATYLTGFTPQARQEHAALYKKDFSVRSHGQEELRAEKCDLAAAAGGRLWKNAGEEMALLNINTPIKPPEGDILFSVSYKAVKGCEPIILLGPRQDDPAIPGRNSYLIGQHAVMPFAVIQKIGFIVAASDYPGPEGGEHELTLYKKDRILVLYRDGAPLLSYYDNHFLEWDSAFAGLGLRGKSECLLRKIYLEVSRPSGKEDGAPSLSGTIVQLQNKRKSYYLMNPFYNRVFNGGSPSFIGVYGYLLQDITSLQEQFHDLEQLYEKQLKRSDRLHHLLQEYRLESEAFIGSSAEITRIKDKARVIADSNATILIQGATGTGKEVLARHIHAQSLFKKGPFIKVDCSTLPRELMESELFGYEKGSFTGAAQRKIGMIEQANRGTLFLDEVANLTLEAQAKLLQFLQDFSFVRIGGQRQIQLNLRVIAASNIELKDLVQQGLFREDLFYRLYVVAINLPELRKRKEDILPLCNHFLSHFSLTANKNIKGLSAGALKKLYEFPWPGNVRELKNVIQQAVIFCTGEEITEDLILLGQDR
jgi:hypothetical protein